MYGHAHMYAIRLSRTRSQPRGIRGYLGTEQQAASHEAAAANSAYQGLPGSVAAVSASAPSAAPQQGGQEQASDGTESVPSEGPSPEQIRSRTGTLSVRVTYQCR